MDAAASWVVLTAEPKTADFVDDQGEGLVASC